MQVGDLVKAHVGNSDYSGGYGVPGQGWWHEYVVVVGDFKTGEGIEYWGESQNSKCCTIDVMMSDGMVKGFAVGRLETV
tara:strand:+ start:926 stop:1162 length:237 start_codon:yes stop_codon:yes gene_type:complete